MMVKIFHPLDGESIKEIRDLNSIRARRRFKYLLHTKISSRIAVLTIIMMLAGTVILAAASSSSFYNITFATATPIRHFVLLYQENNSFDHYFGTYPNATNPPGGPKFIADPHTPSINGLLSAGLLTSNLSSGFKCHGSMICIIYCILITLY
jgi:hypothetical protein